MSLCFAYHLVSLVIQKQEEGELAFGIEDLPYYVRRARDQQLDFDYGVVKQYFPVNLVLSGIFKICQDLFGIVISYDLG